MLIIKLSNSLRDWTVHISLNKTVEIQVRLSRVKPIKNSASFPKSKCFEQQRQKRFNSGHKFLVLFYWAETGIINQLREGKICPLRLESVRWNKKHQIVFEASDEVLDFSPFFVFAEICFRQNWRENFSSILRLQRHLADERLKFSHPSQLFCRRLLTLTGFLVLLFSALELLVRSSISWRFSALWANLW